MKREFSIKFTDKSEDQPGGKSDDKSRDQSAESMEPIKPRESAEQPPTISDAESFDELFDVLDRIGSLRGSQKEYGAMELKQAIHRARTGESGIEVITNTEGLREKVIELIAQERLGGMEKIADAQTFEQLFTFLDAIGGIKGSSKHYPAAELKRLINVVRDEGSGLMLITEAGGLRQRVGELVKMEKIRKDI